MTDTKASPPPEPTNENSSRYAETRIHELGETVSRQEEDIALAAVLLGSGVLSERQIRSAVSDWSIHGSVSLAQHMEGRGTVSRDQIASLMQRVRQRVDTARRSAAGDTGAPGGGRLLLGTLERLDDTGRVAKLLGVTVAASAGADENRVSNTSYRLIRRLGQGGLGRVWLARDLILNRYVALKEISHPSRATDTIVERFKQEAEITGRLVTGYAPHEQTQRVSVDSGVGASGMITAIASGDAPKARDLNASVDPALEAICAKAMARRRYARYQEAAHLAEDVQRWMAGERVTAYQETRRQRSRRWISRHQGLSQAIVAFVMIVLVAVTTLVMAARQRHLDTQQSRFARMEGDVRASTSRNGST